MPWYRLPKSGAPYYSRAPVAGLQPLAESDEEPGVPAPETPEPPQDPAPPKRKHRTAKPKEA